MSNKIIYQKIKEDTFDLKKYFSEYHYHEEQQELKEYTDKSFLYDYGKGRLLYYFRKVVLINEYGIRNHYVVAVEKLTKEERKKLMNFCPCEYCEANVFIQMTSRPFNNGCIVYDAYPRQKYIDEAKINLFNFYNKK